MATIQGSILTSKSFDTALDDALKNNIPLISWKSAFLRLSSPSRSRATNRLLKNWLLSTPQLSSLSTCHIAYPPPTPANKQAFETKTAAINISSESLVPIQQIRKDAQTLGSQLNIDELEALRICILEHQQQVKPTKAPVSAQIGTMFGMVEDKASRTMWKKNIKQDTADGPRTAVPESELEANRQMAHVRLFYSERRYAIKVATLLVRCSQDASTSDGLRNTFHITGKKVLQYMLKHGSASKSKGLVEDIIFEIGNRAKASKGPKFCEDRRSSGSYETVLFEWEKQTLLQQIHLLQFIFILVYQVVKVSATVMTSWINLITSTNFLMDQRFLSRPSNSLLQPLIDSIPPLTSLVFLTFTSLPAVLPHLADIYSGKGKSKEHGVQETSLYIDSEDTLKSLHSILCDYVGERAEPVAALAGWSWAIILNLLKDFIEEAKEYGMLTGDDSEQSTREDILAVYENTLEDFHDASGPAAQPSLYIATGAMRGGLLNVVEQMFLGVGGEGGWYIGMEEDAERMRKVLAAMLRAGMSYLEFDERVLRAIILTHGSIFNEHDTEDKFIDTEICNIDDVDESAESSSPELSKVNANEPLDIDQDVVAAFWADESTLNRTVHPARCRFPFESLPFLSLINAVTPRSIGSEPFNLVQEYLSKHISSFTQVLPDHFSSTEVDENDAENLLLTEPLVVLEPRSEDGEGIMVLPQGTVGNVVSTGIHPPVVRWDHKYSAIQFIGRILEKSLTEDGITSSNQASVIEILRIFDKILVSCRNISTSDDNEDNTLANAAILLEEASDLLAENSDIVSVVFDLFEDGLSTSLDEKNTDLVSAAISLITTLLHILPGRVWPCLGRSTLMERHGRGGSLARIVESVELVRGDYSFLVDCLKLYEALVVDSIRGVVISGTIGSAGSVIGREGVGAGVSRGVQMAIIETWTRFFAGVLESFRAWKYIDLAQRMFLNERILKIFSTILHTVYGVNRQNAITSEQELFSVLSPSATHILSVFLGEEQAHMQLEPIVAVLTDGCTTPETTLRLSLVNNLIRSVNTTLDFANILIRIRAHLGMPPSQLEKQFYIHSPMLVLLYNTDQRYRLSVIELLGSLVSNSGNWLGEPPSIMGYLGQAGARSFVEVLKRLDGRIGDEELECAIWRFFSAVVSNKQQGLSILLVTGSEFGADGTDAKTGTSSETKLEKSMLAIALDILGNIKDLPSTKALAMLEAVYLAQNFWGVVTSDIRKHPSFLTTISNYISELKDDFLPADSDAQVTEKCNRIVAGAYIAQLLAMHLYQSRNLRLNVGSSAGDEDTDSAFLTSLLPKLSFFVQKAVNISGYKPSMHGFLISNFEKKWPSCKLEKLKKSPIFRREYGSSYFYDIDLAGKVLGWDKGWDNTDTQGKKSVAANSKRWGFKSDVEKANLNLALVDAQVVLLHAWSLLAVELTSHIQNPTGSLPATLSKTIISCLKANISDGLPTPISLSVLTERANFAFLLLSKLQAHTPPVPNTIFDDILETTWQAITLSEQTFRHALLAGEMDYFRSLLRIVYLSLQIASKSPKPSPKTLQSLVEIFELVVAKGFKDLAVAAYENKDNSDPADMLLVIGILQAILNFPSIESIHHSLIGHLVDNDTIRAALTLFTWAIKLSPSTLSITGEPDPVFGELSATLLVKLSSLPILAEQLALNNVFVSLSQGELSEMIQAGDLTPNSTPRLHRIWIQTFLPIALNLLFGLGHRIANEVVTFLRSFTRQISTAVQQLIKPKYVTLPLLTELAEIITIVGVLETMGINAMEEFGIQRRAIEAACDQMATHKTWLAKMVVPTTAEEDVLWAGGEEGNQLTDKIIEEVKFIQGLVGNNNA